MVSIRICLASLELRDGALIGEELVVLAVAAVPAFPPSAATKLLGIVVLVLCPDLQLQFWHCGFKVSTGSPVATVRGAVSSIGGAGQTFGFDFPLPFKPFFGDLLVIVAL